MGLDNSFKSAIIDNRRLINITSNKNCLLSKKIMPPGILNEENPLTKYKRANPYISWVKMSKDTGLSNQTLIAVAQRDISQVRALSIETYLIIKNIIGIDLLDESLWGNGYEQKKDIKTTR